MNVDVRGARPLTGVATFIAASMLAHRFLPGHIGLLSDSVVSDGLAAVAASGVTLAGFRTPNLSDQFFALQRGLADAGVTELADAPAQPGALSPDAACVARAKDATRPSAGLVAKHWIYFGAVPDGVSSTAALRDRLHRHEERVHRGLPPLPEEIALRVAGTLTELSQGESAMLKTRISTFVWKQRRAALEDALSRARFHRVLALEERANGRSAGTVSATNLDVPSQSQVATYFLYTGTAPPATVSGSHMQRALNRMNRARTVALDPLAALGAVLDMLQLPPGHPALLPAHRKALPPAASFPQGYSSEQPDVALTRYRTALHLTSSVRDAFLGEDGWQYVRVAGAHRADHAIVAVRGDQYASLLGSSAAIGRRWTEFKLERCAEPLPLHRDADSWHSMMTIHLKRQQRRGRGMKAPLPHVWPVSGDADPWAAARAQLHAYAAGPMSEAPRRPAVTQLAVAVRSATPQQLLS